MTDKITADDARYNALYKARAAAAAAYLAALAAAYHAAAASAAAAHDAAYHAARATYDAALAEANLAAAAMLMDNDIREAIHDDYRASDAEWFLVEYCARHKAQFGEDFSWA